MFFQPVEEVEEHLELFQGRGTSFEAVYRHARFHGLSCVSHLG